MDVEAVPAAAGTPDEVLADNGYATETEVDELTRRGMRSRNERKNEKQSGQERLREKFIYHITCNITNGSIPGLFQASPDFSPVDAMIAQDF